MRSLPGEAWADPRKIQEVLDRQRPPARQRVLGAAEEQQLPASGRQHLEIGVVLGFRDLGKPEINRAFADVGDGVCPVGDLQFDRQVGMLRRQHADGPLARNVRGIGARGDAQFADLQPLGEGDLPHQLMKFGCGPFAVAQHDLAKRGRRHPLPVEQGNAELRLELLEAASQRRLRDAERFRGEAEMMVLRQGLNDFDLSKGVYFCQWILKIR